MLLRIDLFDPRLYGYQYFIFTVRRKIFDSGIRPYFDEMLKSASGTPAPSYDHIHCPLYIIVSLNLIMHHINIIFINTYC